MRVGILTYHRVVNLGSVVQAWCVLQLARQLFPGAAVELIDYRPHRTELRELRKHVSRRYPFWNHRQRQKARALRAFVAAQLPRSAACLRGDNNARAAAWLAAQGYDAVLVGSDTVWELRPGAYSPPGVNLYFLPFEQPGLKIAFAASMDPVPALTPAQRATLAQRLEQIQRFDLISVRDGATAELLRAGGIAAERILRLPDPTLMHGIEPLLATPPFAGRRPVAGVALPRREALRAHASLRRLGYEVWDWNGVAGPDCDRCLPADLAVGEVLALHGAVAAFVTDRFHASIFTLAGAGAPVAFHESPAKWPLANSKGRDLFASLGLEPLVFRDPALLEAPDELAALLQRPDLLAGVQQRLRTVGAAGRAALAAQLRQLELSA